MAAQGSTVWCETSRVRCKSRQLPQTCKMLPSFAGDVEALLETYDRQRRVLPMPMARWSWGWTKSAVRRLFFCQLPSCVD